MSNFPTAVGASKKKKMLGPGSSEASISSPLDITHIVPRPPLVKTEFELCRDDLQARFGPPFLSLGADLEDADTDEAVPVFIQCLKRIPTISAKEVQRGLLALTSMAARLEPDNPILSSIMGIRFSFLPLCRSLVKVNKEITETRITLQEFQFAEVDLRFQFSLSYSFEDLFANYPSTFLAIPPQEREEHFIASYHDFLSTAPKVENLKIRLGDLKAEQNTLVNRLNEHQDLIKRLFNIEDNRGKGKQGKEEED